MAAERMEANAEFNYFDGTGWCVINDLVHYSRLLGSYSPICTLQPLT